MALVDGIDVRHGFRPCLFVRAFQGLLFQNRFLEEIYQAPILLM